MKKFLKITIFFASVWMFAAIAGACEDDITADPDLGLTLEAPEPGAPGTLQEMIYHFYNDYGTYVLDDFTESYIRFTWTIKWGNSYAPVKPGFEPYAIRMLETIEEALLGTFAENTLKHLPYRIFLMDTLKTTSGAVTTLEIRGNDYIIGRIGPSMDQMTESDWTTLKTTVFQEFTARLYQSSPTPPTEFFSLRPMSEEGVSFIDAIGGEWVEDPLREIYDNAYASDDPDDWDYESRYTYMYGGFVEPVWVVYGWTMGRTPTLAKDFADYVSFLLTSPATYIDKIMTREDMFRIQERVLALVPYLKDVLDIDAVAVQNKNQPNDPLPAGYYNRF